MLSAHPGQPFILFVEAGDVDFALHANNLDNAIGAIFSGEEAVGTIVRWVETHSNWDESVLIVSSDHGHYLVRRRSPGADQRSELNSMMNQHRSGIDHLKALSLGVALRAAAGLRLQMVAISQPEAAAWANRAWSRGV